MLYTENSMQFWLGQNIVDPNEKVQSLARIFWFSLTTQEAARLEDHLESGRKPLVGENAHWWWRYGNACPVTMATLSHVPDGMLNTYLVPAIEQLSGPEFEVFRRCYATYERVQAQSKLIHLNYSDIIQVATPQEVRRAATLSRQSIHSDEFEQ